jgi:hypothetical protein
VRFTNPLARWRQRELLRDLSSQIARVEEYLGRRPSKPFEGAGPVIFFNASTRIHRLSLNGAFRLLASGVALAGQASSIGSRGDEPLVLVTDRRSPEARRLWICLTSVPFFFASGVIGDSDPPGGQHLRKLQRLRSDAAGA